MRQQVGLVFTAVFFLLTRNAVKADEDVIPQIKAVKVQFWEVNPDYYEKFELSIVKHNETFNDVVMDILLKQDLPADAYLENNVYVTDSDYNNPELLVQDTIPLCQTSSHADLLPDAVVNFVDTCYKQGQTLSGPTSNFRFDALFPNIHEISDYHYNYMVFGAPDLILAKVTIYSQWGYL